jgi:hypothetical protein
VAMKKELFMLIHVAVSGDRNVIKKEAEKILKYIKTLEEKYSVCAM